MSPVVKGSILIRRLNLILLITLLVPLSVDRGMGVFVHGFQVRGQYFSFFLLFWIAFFHRIRMEGFRTFISNEVREPMVQALLPLAILGAIAAILSFEPWRATLYWFWTVGTLFGIPFLLRYWTRTGMDRWAILGTLGYFLIQSWVVIIDTGVCTGSHGRWGGIGRNMIYTMKGGETLCRPTAWYQEPGYFCAFGLLVVVLALGVSATLKADPRLKRLVAGTAFAGTIAMAFSTSRMGWIGLVWIASWLIWKYRAWLRQSLKWVYGFLGILAVFAVLLGPVVYKHVGRGLIHPSQDASFGTRYRAQEAALTVFRTFPWLGAGPGMAQHSYVHQTPPDTDGYKAYLVSTKSQYNGPLSMSLYPELLSEWGILGTLAFALFLGVWIFRVRRTGRVLLLGALLIVYLSNPTLARFDLWWTLALCL